MYMHNNYLLPLAFADTDYREIRVKFAQWGRAIPKYVLFKDLILLINI